MLDNMLFFIDPIIEMSEDDTCFVIHGETLFDVQENIGSGKTASSPDETKIRVPLDIVMSLLRKDELDKLRKYITLHTMKHDRGDVG